MEHSLGLKLPLQSACLILPCHVSFWKYDHTAAVIEEAMHNVHNYEFSLMMFTLATIIGLQFKHTILPKLLIFNLITTKSK
jgi:hypothetical protein